MVIKVDDSQRSWTTCEATLSFVEDNGTPVQLLEPLYDPRKIPSISSPNAFLTLLKMRSAIYCGTTAIRFAVTSTRQTR